MSLVESGLNVVWPVMISAVRFKNKIRRGNRYENTNEMGVFFKTRIFVVINVK
jgi:hypothetical protein